ncbi:type II toxin-antitoxin system Phd/YefM family antitoxin [Cellulosimicrobium marinum]|uniref:type II toxin-antitoxin system Phd/YefM family antitoxin n=1 Tax=Cellulosimicrobium marinum TaxID=1638992 RepID=UPI001E494D6C|nr:type II toxin-antitoxin system prevent-host-death family antitoxin [Cellulosimicrobium marinum]MCB7136113.1 type II toxin-antitoxin system prevent-host-death family antitoxin [Cellulosimicrobium marinum]
MRIPEELPTVGVRDLNQRTSAVLRMVREGTPVVVTDHGHPVARIVPITSSPYERLVAEGEYVPATASALVAPPAEAQGRPTADVLAELRGDRT